MILQAVPELVVDLHKKMRRKYRITFVVIALRLGENWL